MKMGGIIANVCKYLFKLKEYWQNTSTKRIETFRSKSR